MFIMILGSSLHYTVHQLRKINGTFLYGATLRLYLCWWIFIPAGAYVEICDTKLKITGGINPAPASW